MSEHKNNPEGKRDNTPSVHRHEDEQEHPSSLFDPTMEGQTSSANPPPLTPNNIMKLQSLIGNQAVQRLLKEQSHSHTPEQSRIQREEAASEGTGLTWSPPPEFQISGTATTKSEAWNLTTDVKYMLQDLEDSLTAEIEGADTSGIYAITLDLRDIGTNIGATEEPDAPLTEQDVQRLVTTTQLARARYEGGVELLREHITSNVGKLKVGNISGRLSAITPQIAEMLRTAFIEGIAPDEIQQAQQALATIDECKGYVDEIKGWVEDVNEVISSAKITELCETVDKYSEKVGEYVSLLQKTLNGFDALRRLGTPGVSSSFRSVAALRLSMTMADSVAGSSLGRAVPVFGQVWEYYSTATSAILDNVEKILKARDKDARELAEKEMIFNMTAGAVDDYGAPLIPPQFAKYFPGRQPIFGFMYALMNGGNPSVTHVVEQFFVTHADQLNIVYEDDNEKLETEWNLFSADRAPALITWIHKNKHTVWAQLYGNLPTTF